MVPRRQASSSEDSVTAANEVRRGGLLLRCALPRRRAKAGASTAVSHCGSGTKRGGLARQLLRLLRSVSGGRAAADERGGAGGERAWRRRSAGGARTLNRCGSPTDTSRRVTGAVERMQLKQRLKPRSMLRPRQLQNWRSALQTTAARSTVSKISTCSSDIPGGKMPEGSQGIVV